MTFKLIIITIGIIVIAFCSWFIGFMILTLERGNKNIKEAYFKQNKILQFISATVLGFVVLYIFFAIVEKITVFENGGGFID